MNKPPGSISGAPSYSKVWDGVVSDDSDNVYVKAICVVMPSGEALWAEQENFDLEAFLRSWEAQRPEYAGTPCTACAVLITMPRDKFQAIPAQCGGGAYEWPR